MAFLLFPYLFPSLLLTLSPWCAVVPASESTTKRHRQRRLHSFPLFPSLPLLFLPPGVGWRESKKRRFTKRVPVPFSSLPFHFFSLSQELRPQRPTSPALDVQMKRQPLIFPLPFFSSPASFSDHQAQVQPTARRRTISRTTVDTVLIEMPFSPLLPPFLFPYFFFFGLRHQSD